jgi:hypothetical protein
MALVIGSVEEEASYRARHQQEHERHVKDKAGRGARSAAATGLTGKGDRPVLTNGRYKKLM